MALFEQYVSKSAFSSYGEFVRDFAINAPEDFNFAYDVVDRLAAEKPDKRALLWVSREDEARAFTFAQIKRMSDKTANFFRKQGIVKGDKVMLVLKRHYQFWYCILALHKLGAVAVPATNLLMKKDYEYRCNAAGIKMIVATQDGDVTDRVDEAAPGAPTLKLRAVTGGKKAEGWLDFDAEVDACPDAFERPAGEQATRNDDMMLLYFTSGTTGYPKMVWHDFTYPLGHIVTAKYWQDVSEDGLHLTISETGWAKAMWGKLYGQWLAETCVFVYDFDKFDPDDMLSKISRYKVTTFCAPPTMYRFMIQCDLGKYDLSALRHTVIAGEPLNPEVYNQWLSRTGLKLYEGFGQTECTIIAGTFPFMEPTPGSMGRPSAGYDVVIINEEGKPVGSGEVGEICIDTRRRKPYGVFRGYYLDGELTDAVWHDGLYHTGDNAWMDEQGYLWYVGRIDDVIKSSGYRIGPFEVESVLLEHPAVVEAAVTGVPDEVRGAIVKATVILAKEYEPTEALKRELQEHVKHATAPYKYPRIIEFVDQLPKTISGKIRRVQIRAEDTKR